MTVSVHPYRHTLYAVLLLLPTFVGIGASFYLLFVGAVFFFEFQAISQSFSEFKKRPFDKKYRLIWLAGIIVFVSLLNKLVNGQSIICLKDYYSPIFLFPFLLITSHFAFHLKLFKALIVITCIEVLFGMVEYTMGVRSILMESGENNLISDYHLLYNSRVFGLSVNSSVLSLKIFVAFILMDFVLVKKWQNWTLRIILLAGLIISFSRIVVFLLLVYWLAQLIIGIVKHRNWAWKIVDFQFYSVVILLTILFFSPVKEQLLRGDHEAESVIDDVQQPDGYQLTCAESHAIPMRSAELITSKQGWGDKLMLGAENVQTSGRKKIWLNYINYTQDHLLFGNGSDKLMLRWWDPKKGGFKLIHAHNSFIELIASNGVIIGGLILLFYLLIFSSGNLISVALIVLYSFGNYGIFWSFSYLDVIFLMLLTFQMKSVYDYTREG